MSAAPRATVLVPTHDHGSLLRWSVGSALRQTVRDLEVLIVGDGASPAGVAAAEALAREDPRVRFLPFPKGPRHGEVHRHAALRESKAGAVLYLSDDDLWLPDHAARLLAALEGADFAATSGVEVRVDGTLRAWASDLARPWYRDRARRHDLPIPLSSVGHTRAAYDRLADGWTTTPEGMPTDRFLWGRLLSLPEIRAVTDPVPTLLQFPSPDRKGWTEALRAGELELWDRELRSAEGSARIAAGTWEAVQRVAADEWERVRRMEESPSWRIRERLLSLVRPRRRAGGEPGSP